jgi:hypothetical protein
MDRREKTNDFRDWNTASFEVASPSEARFVRLTQTGRNHEDGEQLVLYAVEFFGTISQ